MKTGPAQIIMICLIVINLIASSILDGTEKEGKHKFSVDFVLLILSQALIGWGGFWF